MEKIVKKFYDSIAEKYHKITADHFYNAYLEVPATMSLIKQIKNKQVLDLGCGTGRHTKVLQRRRANVYGIDLSRKMIKIAKNEVKSVKLVIGSAYNLPYKSGCFDLVVAGLVADYFEDLDKAFREIYRVLKKSGIFIFSIKNPLIAVSESIKGMPKTYRKFGNYFKEGKMYVKWPSFNLKTPYYHRTFQSWIRAIIRNDFILEDFLDAKPIKAGRKINPEAFDTYSKIPHFSVFKVRKL